MITVHLIFLLINWTRLAELNRFAAQGSAKDPSDACKRGELIEEPGKESPGTEIKGPKLTPQVDENPQALKGHGFIRATTPARSGRL